MALCAADGITANQSHADRNGWDVLIEVDQDTASLTQQTLHEPVMTGTVQVKSTRSKSLKVNVTLSNLRKMATSSLPAFYLLMDYSRGQLPSRAFLIHVDEALIQRILERANIHLVAGEQNQLNKHKMTIDFSLGQELTLDGSVRLKTELLNAIGNSQAEYTDRKQRFLKSVGFENGSHLMRFNLVGEENLQAMINATLGKWGPVELQDIQIIAQRFGVEDPKSRRHASVATLVIEPSAPSTIGMLTLRNIRTGDSVEIDATFHVSALHSVLPSHMLQIRIDCGLFDWYINSDGTEAKFVSSLDPQAPVKLEDLCSFLQAIRLLTQPEGLSVDMDFNGRKASFKVNGGVGLPDYPGILEVAEALLELKMMFRDRGHLEVSVEELLQGSHDIRGFGAFLKKQVVGSVSFTVDGKTEPFAAVCLVPLELNVGDKHYLAVLAVSEEMTLLPNGRFSMPTSNFEVVYRSVFNSSERTSDTTLQQLQRVVDEYSHPLPIICLMELQAPASENRRLQ